MRASLAVLALVALTAGCGSSGGRAEGGARPGSLAALWRGAAESVALIAGTNDYSVGDVRISFVVVTGQGQVVERPRARFWIARSRDSRPFAQTTAVLEPVAVSGGVADSGDVKTIFVAHVPVDRPGSYWIVARPSGGRSIAGLQRIVVKRRSESPAVGSRAYPSHTPTLATARGRMAALTTRVPPDRDLLRFSVAGSLAARVPFVLIFATPRFCTSRTCGPVVDVVEAVSREFAGDGARFIHVEIYDDNNPAKGENRWVREWRLPSEPWTFVVGRDGRISAKFEGPISTRELGTAVRGALG